MSLSLHTAVTRLYHAQKNNLRPQMAALGLSPGQPKLLRYLAAHKQCIQRELAVSCDIEPATVSRLLNRMEADGFVSRSVSNENRRITTVTLLPKGQAAYEAWAEISKEADKLLLQGFSEEEATAVFTYLSAMYTNLTGRQLD